MPDKLPTRTFINQKSNRHLPPFYVYAANSFSGSKVIGNQTYAAVAYPSSQSHGRAGKRMNMIE